MPDTTSTGMAALITVATAILTVFADWVHVIIEVPIGVMMVLVALILLPTGDILRLWSIWVTRLTDDRIESEPGHPVEKHDRHHSRDGDK